MVPLSFAYSRLVKVKAGPAVKPMTYPIEPDLAESWTQPSDTTYVFKLRRGVRWHNKPPVNGRELTADDVKYTYQGRAGTPRHAPLPQLARDARDQRVLAGPRRAQPCGAGGGRRVVHPDRPAHARGPGALRVRHRSGAEAARTGGARRRFQGAGGDHGRVRTGLPRRRADRPEGLEGGGRHRRA